MKLFFLFLSLHMLALGWGAVFAQETNAEKKEERIKKAVKLYEEKNWASSLALVKENLKDKELHRRSFELYALLQTQLGDYKEALRTYYLLVKHTHYEGALQMKDQEEMKDFLRKNPRLTRPDNSVLTYYQQMGLCYALWAESVLLSTHDLAREYYIKAHKYLLFIDHFQFSDQHTTELRERVDILEKEFLYRPSEERNVEKEEEFERLYSLSIGIMSYQEDVLMRYRMNTDLTLHSQVLGQSFLAAKAWRKERYEVSLQGGLLTGVAKVVSARPDLIYEHNHTEIFGLILGPGLLWRPRPQLGLGARAYYFYRSTAYQDPSDDFHIEGSQEHSALLCVEGRYEVGSLIASHQLGYSPALGYALWMFQLGVAF